MKKNYLKLSFYGLFFLALTSCSGGDQSGSQKTASSASKASKSEVMEVMEKLKEDGEIEDDEFKSLKKKLDNYYEKENENSSSAPKDVENALKLNSYDLFEKIYKDRSVYLDEYLNKTIILTDVYIYDVRTEEKGEGFLKVAYGIPYNPKSNSTIFYKDISNINGKFVEQNYDIELSQYYEPIRIEFSNAKEMDKLGLLAWEGDDSMESFKKIDIIANFNRASLKHFESGDNISNNMKANDITLRFHEAEIYLPNKKK